MVLRSSFSLLLKRVMDVVMIMLVVMMAIVMDAGDDDAYDYADVHVFLFAI
jgi:hypothetical protein